MLGVPGPDDDFWYNAAPGGSTWAGNRVSEESSLQSVAVYACNRILSETIASLSRGIYRYSTRKGKVSVPNHPLNSVISLQANQHQTAFEFWEYLDSSWNLWGNAYALPEYLENNGVDVVGLHALDPCRMQVSGYFDKNGVLVMRGYKYSTPGSRQVDLEESQVWHIPGFGFDGVKGYSPIQLLRQSIGEGLAAEEYASRFYANNAAPRMYVSQPNKLGNEARENLTKWFKDNFGGLANAHKLGVLEGGGEIKVVPVNHRDVQFLETRKFNLEQIARIFRVPLHLIQSLDHATNNNIEHQGIGYVIHSVRPKVVRYEQRLDLLLRPSERARYSVEFNLEDLMRGDLQARAE